MNNVKEIYDNMMPSGGFILDEEHSNIEAGECCYKLVDKGEGQFWNFFYKDMFVIEKMDFKFYEDFLLESKESDFIAIQYYSSVSGEELLPYKQLIPNTLRTYVGDHNKTFKAIYHKNIPIKCIAINIMPEFYNRYLKEKLGGEYINPRDILKDEKLAFNLPELSLLLKQINNYSGQGSSAKLFYEAKVLELIAMIIDYYQNHLSTHLENITANDENNLLAIAKYIDHHYSLNISNKQLAKMALMSETKLKTKFKFYFGLTISNYIIKKRVEQAEYLLINTDLSIAEIAKLVGYNRSENFAKQFSKITGILPHDYRKFAQ